MKLCGDSQSLGSDDCDERSSWNTHFGVYFSITHKPWTKHSYNCRIFKPNLHLYKICVQLERQVGRLYGNTGYSIIEQWVSRDNQKRMEADPALASTWGTRLLSLQIPVLLS